MDPDFWQIGMASVAVLPVIRWNLSWFMDKTAHNNSMNILVSERDRKYLYTFVSALLQSND
jgi:hypothetical protein